MESWNWKEKNWKIDTSGNGKGFEIASKSIGSGSKGVHNFVIHVVYCQNDDEGLRETNANNAPLTAGDAAAITSDDIHDIDNLKESKPTSNYFENVGFTFASFHCDCRRR